MNILLYAEDYSGNEEYIRETKAIGVGFRIFAIRAEIGLLTTYISVIITKPEL